VFTGKVELGQGILTALAQIAAEELDLPLARLKMISGDTAQTPNEGMTAGSQSIENSGLALRMAGAEVRAILIDLAAKKLGVAADTLKVADGVISASDGRKVSYGELAAEADFKREATAKVAPKKPADHRIVGKSIPRLDIPGKVTGGVAFVQDMRMPNMAHGRVVRPPRAGSTLESVDEAAAKAIAGVIAVVRDGSFLGVVAEREEQAVKAREALIRSAKWKLGPELPDPATIYAHLKSLPSVDQVIGVKQAGPVLASAKTLQATYTKPYQAHASIGPSCAVAQLADGRMTVWTHSQGVFPLHPCRRLGLLRPQRRRRCGARRRIAGAWRAGPAGPPAVDAGRRVCLGTLRDRDGHAGERRARRRRQDRQLGLRSVEQLAFHASGFDQRHQRAGGLVSGRAAEDGPAHLAAAAGRRRRPQLRPDLRLPEPEGGASLPA
jgi:CO/xanthine dehydrogenase Mo-binding subunit